VLKLSKGVRARYFKFKFPRQLCPAHGTRSHGCAHRHPIFTAAELKVYGCA
jgi:hypothetical protein